MAKLNKTRILATALLGTIVMGASIPSHAQNFRSSSQGFNTCLLYTSPSPRDATLSRMPSSA